MMEIRNLLVGRGCIFHDKNLMWGAKASNYVKELRKIGSKTPVLVELEIDIDLPEGAKVIDHHNAKAGQNQATSIEQVAALLGIKLDRWQKLIAANDRGWIAGLKASGATKQEVEKIRKYDRSCQGVTEEMEAEAERVCSKVVKTNRPIVIHYGYDLISPITDRLYGVAENILIIGPKSTTFSGDGQIILKMASTFPNSFYGGELPKRGFWGLPYRDEKAEELIIKYWEELNDKKGFSEICNFDAVDGGRRNEAGLM